MVGPSSALRTPSAADRGKLFYRVLGLPECTPADGVKRKYKELALKLHPDKNLNDPQAVEKFQAINTAYETLSNPEKKKIVDDALVMAQTALTPPDNLHTAATMFRKQQSTYHDELNAFRMRRRASSQSTTRATGAAATAPDRPSQYTKEQTDFFRQREKEREREMSKRLEKEKEQQREVELEKYRNAQEERLRDEERRAREARAKLEKAEAALLAATNRAFNNVGSPIGTGGSFRGLQRRDGQPSQRSSSCDATGSSSSPLASSTNIQKMSSPNTPRPTGGLASSSTLATPRNNLTKRSPSLSRTSPLEQHSTELPPHAQPSMSASTSCVSPLDNFFTQSSSTPLSAKLKRERERQDEHKRSEQEQYLLRKLGEIRDRDAQRAQSALDEEARLYHRELQLVHDNERSERTQFLEQEEGLERRMLVASFKRVERSLVARQSIEPLKQKEAATRSAMHALEHCARQCLLVALRSTHVRSSVEAQEIAERSALVDHGMVLLERARNTTEELQRVARLEVSLRHKSEAHSMFGARLLHTAELMEPVQRTDLEKQFLSTHSSLITTCVASQALLTSVYTTRRNLLHDERVHRGGLSLNANEMMRRRILLEMEVDSFVHLQKCRGLHLQNAIRTQAREHHAEMELMKMRHDAEVTKLLEELSRLHQQLADARSMALATSVDATANVAHNHRSTHQLNSGSSPSSPSSSSSPRARQQRSLNTTNVTSLPSPVVEADASDWGLGGQGTITHTEITALRPLSAQLPQQPVATQPHQQHLLYPPEIPTSHTARASDRSYVSRVQPLPDASGTALDVRQLQFASPLQKSATSYTAASAPVVVYNIPPPTQGVAQAGAGNSGNTSPPLGALHSTPLLRSKQWGGGSGAIPTGGAASGIKTAPLNATTPPPGIRRANGNFAAEL